MKISMKFTLALLAGLLLWPATAAFAQSGANEGLDPKDVTHNQEVDPEGIFDFVNSHAYSSTMTITAVVQKDGLTLNHALVAVYADDGIRGKDIVRSKNQVYLTVYGESAVPLVFKVYVDGVTYVVDQGLQFEGNGTLGLDTPYVITLQNPVLLGDVNDDGTVDIADAVAVANHIIGLTPVKFVKSAADVNNDGSITVADAAGIVKMIL
ncbi:MAG: dockerin type I repeat-containing protein [Prevotella sp.]|nr:dockerin type I repeat-containing protein [Prevotella sp.]